MTGMRLAGSEARGNDEMDMQHDSDDSGKQKALRGI